MSNEYDREQKIQRERGERAHHERLEQLQLGDENVEASIARSKEGEAEKNLQPRIISSPNTQQRDL